MNEPTKERWQKLCEQAVIEKDPEVLLGLCLEINRILEEKDKQLKLSRKSAAEGQAA